MNILRNFKTNNFSILSIAFAFAYLFCPNQAAANNPDFTLTCPADISIYPSPGDCSGSITVDYSDLVWSSSIPLVDTIYSPAPGTSLVAGTYPASIVTENNLGITEVCNFQITIVGNNTSLTCNNFTEVGLEPDCDTEITWDMILEGGPYPCPENYFVEILSPLGQNLGSPIVDFSMVGTNWTVVITDTLQNHSCWGQLAIDYQFIALACPPSINILCNAESSPDITGEPVVDSCFPNSQLTIDYFDSVTTFDCTDSLSYKITRTWHAEDPWGNENSCEQIINALRLDLSEVVFPPNFDGIAEPTIACSNTIPVSELADISDTGIPTVNGVSLEASFCDFTTTYEDILIPVCGNHYKVLRTWTVVDWCTGQISTENQIIKIEDTEAPTFNYPDTLWVSSNSDCETMALIPSAENIDDCSEFGVQIDLPWETLTQNGGLATISQVPGTYEIDYVLTDSCGNVNTGTSVLIVEENILVSCPSDVTIDCSLFWDDLHLPLENGDMSVLSMFGDANFAINCPFEVLDTALVNVDFCGAGIIERTITSINTSVPHECVQNIYVEHISGYSAEFPEDMIIECTGNSFPDTGSPNLMNADCEQILVEFEDIVFDVVPDACYKILRTWSVINLCNYDSLLTLPDSLIGPWQYVDGGDGHIEYQQVIKVIDNSEPQFTNGCLLPSVCIEDNTCVAVVNIPEPEILDCSGDVALSVTSDLGNGFGPFPNVTPGTYAVNYTAIDNCGNSESCSTNIQILDCKNPTPYCINGLVVQLSGTPPTATVYAEDIDAGSFDNCAGNISMSFSSFIPDDSRTFTCADVGDVIVDMWVTDAAGNQDFCTTLITVWEPDNGGCFIDCFVSGSIRTEESETVGKVTISLDNDPGNQMITGNDGYYCLEDPSSPGDYEVVPFKDINPWNGVTTLDVILMAKHILGIQLLSSPYKLIAADANNSGYISTLDIIEIRKLILNINTNFPNNTSWRFVVEDYVFPNPLNPWQSPFPGIININGGQGGEDLNFIGIKTGDVNNTADPSNFQNSDDRNFVGKIDWRLPNIKFEKDEIISVPFTIEKGMIHGYQFALEFNNAALELIEIIPGLAVEENFGKQFLGDGIITTSWHTEEAINVNKEEVFFNLKFKAKEKGSLNGLLDIRKDLLQAEAYSENLELMNIGINHFENEILINNFELFQNSPNPFSDITLIPFFLPENSEVDLVITDISGKVVKTLNGYFEKGRNELEISASDFTQSGIYIYQLKAGKYEGRGKMMIEN